MKNLSDYGDAGAIVTNSHEWALKVRMITNHGRTEKYNSELKGVSSRLDGLQVAILGIELKHLPQWSESRIRSAYLYNKYLEDTDLVTPVEIKNVKTIYHLYVLRVPQMEIETLGAFEIKRYLYWYSLSYCASKSECLFLLKSRR